jgi:hypothetical protein
MPVLSRRNTIVIAAALSIVMCATRGQHFAGLNHLPDASWAVFFLLGFYIRNRLLLPLFLSLAALTDCIAVTQFGISNYCLTPAYPFLIPAYAALWLAGRWSATHYHFDIHSLPQLAFAAVGGIATCEIISSGSFYFLGGRFSDITLAEFIQRLIQYFPADLAGSALYLGIAALFHVLVSLMHRPAATT